MRDNFINWLLGIGPTQFSIEQQLPCPPKKDDEPKKHDDKKLDTNPDHTALGPPRC
jgi:hypothetical protein